jgi:hypothetical protein
VWGKSKRRCNLLLRFLVSAYLGCGVRSRPSSRSRDLPPRRPRGATTTRHRGIVARSPSHSTASACSTSHSTSTAHQLVVLDKIIQGHVQGARHSSSSSSALSHPPETAGWQTPPERRNPNTLDTCGKQESTKPIETSRPKTRLIDTYLTSAN